MNLLPIRILPDPILKKIASPIEEITDKLIQTLDMMLHTMYAEKGIGLAANQVGILSRMIVIDTEQHNDFATAYQMINPEIVSLSDEQEPYSEGCLSIPNVSYDVVRPISGVFRYLDIKGDSHEIEADGLLARCIQHEIDHLNGVLFIDHLSNLRKNMIIKSFTKQQRASS